MSLLHGAVGRRSPDLDVNAVDWPRVLTQARQHRVDAFLYPWLAESMPYLFSSQAPVSADSAPAAWRTLFLESVAASVRRQRQLEEILRAFAKARLDIVPLKGAWLSENVYDTPAQRTMSDMDLLVRADDVPAAHALFLGLGYNVRSLALNNPFACDQAYHHASYPSLIELHWNFASESVKEVPKPDLDAVWRCTRPARLRGCAVCAFSLEDQLAHLVQHLLHHQLAVPLRWHLDIALFLKRFGPELSPSALAEASARWRIGQAMPFVSRFAASLFNLSPPACLSAVSDPEEPTRRADLLEALFDLPTVRERDGESTLLRYRHASLVGRLRLIAERVFMPRAYLALRYPCANRACGLPLAWCLRAQDLARLCLSHAHTASPSAERHLMEAQKRTDLVQWLLKSPPF